MPTVVEGQNGKDPESASEAPPVADGCIVVGVGASAGGLDAFQRFLRLMPAHPRIALVYVQHLDPKHESILPELLSRYAQVPVQPVHDKTAVEPGHVYVIPPDTRLTIERGVLRLGPRLDQAEFGKPIDGFFASLADDQGQRAVGIVLSGTGSDGTAGLRAIKERGGMTIAQQPDSAAYDSMPQSAIAAGVADHVLAPEEMPEGLVKHAAGEKPAPAAGSGGEERPGQVDPVARITAAVHRRTGHDFSYYKRDTLLRRVRRRMADLQIQSCEEYADRLGQDPDEVPLLLKELLIQVTGFFRDPDAFKVLAQTAIPRLFEGKSAADQVRVWVAGCSSGEEVYSLAILLREQVAALPRSPEGEPRVLIFATDIDEEALNTARQGRYPESIAEHVSAERLQRFFTRSDGGYRVRQELRDLCVFSSHNLIQDPPFPNLDLISCRNLLIYLDARIQGKVIAVFHYALRAGGFLFLGAAESIASRKELFEPLDRGQRVYRRRDRAIRTPLELPVAWKPGGGKPAPGPAAVSPVGSEVALQRVLERLVLDDYTPPGMVVRESGDVVYVFGPIGPYLAPSAGASFNALALVHKDLRNDVRSALKEADQTHQPALRPGLAVRLDSRVQALNLIVRPLTEVGGGLYVVIFREVAAAPEGVPAAAPSAPDVAALEQLQHELNSTREQLQATVEELTTANQELQSSNEELLSMNEEMQSSNEELQTSKEEVQSINEELQSVNAELSQRVAELDTARSDLESLFEGTQIATVFVDNELQIKRFTPTATDLFRLREGDVGRPVADIVARFTNGDVESEIREVLRTLQRKEISVHRADDGAHYLMRILPYRTRQNRIDGVAIAFVDVTEIRRKEEALRASEARFRSAVESLLDAFAIWRPIRGDRREVVDFCLEYVNERAVALTGRSREELTGMRALQGFPGFRESGLFDSYRRVLETGEPFLADGIAYEGGGVPGRYYDVRASRLGDGIAVAWQDVTERHEAAAELREASRRKDEFLAMLGHELRNPLAAIVHSVELLQDAAGTNPRWEQAAEVARRQAVHMARLLDDLLDAGRVTQGKMELKREPLDLRRVVEDAVAVMTPVIQAKGHQLAVSLPSQPLPVEGDPARLQQVVGNLLNNAAKYTPSGGHIWLTAEREAPSGPPEPGGEREGWVVVRVRDDGIGIAPELLPHVFDLFVQSQRSLDRSQGGLGIGLTLVRRLVELHGGSVEAHSEGEGKGSEFVVRLPLRSTEPEAGGAGAPKASAAPVGQAHGSLDGRKILLVEDNADAAEVLGMLLEAEGHEVVVAHDGPAAVHLAEAYLPEAALIDIGLPGMDGYEVARRLRRNPALNGTKLVALTGYGQDEDRERSREAGFDEHLVKPVDLIEMRRVLAAGPEEA
ncbi:MAG: PAS domain-containing protein [Armatimonadetes bacterium]|nr:PAS domain-containing protein [Armatimonadota bacterium]